MYCACRMTQAKQDESSFGFFKNLAKRQGLSMGGCAVGLLVGLFLAYQVLSLLVWLVSKVLGFGAVMVCSRYSSRPAFPEPFFLPDSFHSLHLRCFLPSTYSVPIPEATCTLARPS